MTQQDSDDEHELADPTPQQWQLYERQVRDMLDAMDPGADAQHNVLINGDLSGTLRQVYVRVTGTLAGQQITIAVECNCAWASRPDAGHNRGRYFETCRQSILELDLALKVILPADFAVCIAQPQRVSGFLHAG